MNQQKRNALGKGFGALISASPTINADHAQQEILLAHIKPNHKQPRTYFDQDKVDELAQSIKIKGVIQPIIVRENTPGDYELVVGERRFLAAKKAGLDKIPAIVKKISDTEMQEIALIENIQREDLNPIEEAKAYQSLMQEHNYTQEILSKRLGKNRSTVANIIRLLKLPQSIQTSIAEKKLSAGHARCFLSVDDQIAMQELFQETIAKEFSVRDLEKKVKALHNGSNKRDQSDRSDEKQYFYNAQKLENQFGIRVKIREKNNKGKIEFYFDSIDAFNSLFKRLNKK